MNYLCGLKDLTMNEPTLNEAKKDYFAPMHTAEHILNQTMVRMFGCERSKNAHIERKKSKCDYNLPQAPTEAEVIEIARRVNEVISQKLDVFEEFMPYSQAEGLVDLSKLPDDVSETLRVIKIGDYDACACIGEHVSNTSEIGTFEITTHDFENGRWRVRWRVR